MSDLLTEDDLQSLHFSEHGIGGYSILIPPRGEGAIVELRAMPSESGWMISLLQGTPDEPDVREDHVVLTSLPHELTRARFFKLLEVLGVKP